MKKLGLVVALISLSIATTGVADEDENTLYIEGLIERHITPGQEEMIEYKKVYALTSLPLVIATHAKVTNLYQTLHQKAAKAISNAKKADSKSKYSGAGIISVRTFTRKIDSGEQKFWIFTVSYQKWEDKKFPGVRVDVAHFLAGAYILHENKRVIPLTSKPLENLNFLATFAVKDGPFKPKGAKPPVDNG